MPPFYSFTYMLQLYIFLITFIKIRQELLATSNSFTYMLYVYIFINASPRYDTDFTITTYRVIKVCNIADPLI